MHDAVLTVFSTLIDAHLPFLMSQHLFAFLSLFPNCRIDYVSRKTNLNGQSILSINI